MQPHDSLAQAPRCNIEGMLQGLSSQMSEEQEHESVAGDSYSSDGSERSELDGIRLATSRPTGTPAKGTRPTYNSWASMMPKVPKNSKSAAAEAQMLRTSFLDWFVLRARHSLTCCASAVLAACACGECMRCVRPVLVIT
jgi:hypothetical protein